jgi:hypothetical protein
MHFGLGLARYLRIALEPAESAVRLKSSASQPSTVFPPNEDNLIYMVADVYGRKRRGRPLPMFNHSR